MRVMNCKEAMRLAAAHLDRRLPMRQRIALWLHVSGCRMCAAARAQMTAIDHLLRERMQQAEHAPVDDGDVELSPEAQERIREALRREAS